MPTEIAFDTDARAEVEAARADLAAGRFAEAQRRFGALAEVSGNPDLFYLQALSAYEGGALSASARAIAAGLSRAGEHPALLLLSGLVHADQGRGDSAFALLDRAVEAAPGDSGLRARVELNRGVVRLDRGELDLAEAAFRSARSLASASGAAEVVTLADENLRLVADLRGRGGAVDPLSAVSDRLRKGDVAGARTALSAPNLADRRSVVRHRIAEANIARAEGRWDAAADALLEAGRAAEEAGLVREQAAALADLGIIYGLAGRWAIASERIADAIARVEGTSFRLHEMTYRIEAGRIACRAGRLDDARQQWAKAKAISSTVQDPMGSARLAELEGLIAAKSDRPADASAAYERALRALESLSYWADAARVATAWVELNAGRDPAALTTARSRALELFRQAGDVLGPAHVAVAVGLGAAQRGQLDVALRSFAEASEAAGRAGTARGDQIARIAKENAAQTLIALGHSADAVEQAKAYGLESMVERERQFGLAEAAYERGRVAHDAGRYSEAFQSFDSAYRAFETLREPGYALKARRGRAWSEFNAATTLTVDKAFPIWQKLVEESLFVQDAELRARAMAAVALAAGELKRPEAADSLRAGADAAERAGLWNVSGQCYAMLVEVSTQLRERSAAARKAFQLRSGDRVGVYAMYSVAVDAFNAEDYALARALATEALPKAADLRPALNQILESAPP